MSEEKDNTGNNKLHHAREIVRHLKHSGYEAYFVGGCVRDFILGHRSSDYDIVTSARPDQIIALFPRTLTIGAKFGVVAVMIEHYPYEVATFRSDDTYEDGRHPSQVHFSTAREDVVRRDFTINGLLMDPTSGEILDYVNGRSDIENKIIRTIGDPDSRFNEDYLRMLRAVRFAANLQFVIEPETKNAITRNAHKINQISAERVRDELNKILTGGGARSGFELLRETNLLREVLPEVAKLQGVEQPPRFHPEGDVWKHTLNMLALLPAAEPTDKYLCLAWGTLLHDVGKPLTRSEDEKGVHFYGHVQKGEEIADDILQRLRFSRAQRETVLALIRQHMVFMNVQKMRPGRLKRFLRMPDFDLHLELHRLDCMASHGMLDNYEFCLEHLQLLSQEDLHPPRLLNGNDLMAMGFPPGKIIGEILLALEEEQLEGRIKTGEEARNYVRERWKINP
ncbi:MAG TPA: CCA tRNA nucleotidyltransferase [Smithella sp.]|nr:CCA tRNA nucleotidyltransferase [Smithella sp.]MDM7988620.1 CCA tRNA nucleotidyltransferase [Smithella sp.]HNY51308.1 CCA tRNA nucleotidyltransferase [Smithella sp.]HOG91452.1 CCA tRNA nucleotidyltransferase [Smithella sp.]HOU51379.1 CCA tRNA nucleotidyltransferase [Smithella sp.]